MTDRYAVIGHPIAHSKSPWIHARFAQETGQDIAYEALLGRLDAFEEDVRQFQAQGGLGLNVTLPFKEQAFAMAHERSPRAEVARAANALRFHQGRIWAENFDGVGLVHDVQHNLGFALEGKRILVLGAGGASRGIVAPLLQCRPCELVVANRTPARADELVRDMAHLGPLAACTWQALRGPFDAIFNATSASLGAALPPLAPGLLQAHGLAYDLMYGKGRTAFLQWAADTTPEARRADGAGMLVEQAAESFAWWRGIRPPTAAVLQALRTPGL